MFYQKIIETPIGKLLLITSEKKVISIEKQKEFCKLTITIYPKILLDLEEQIYAYFNGKLKKFNLSLDFSQMTNFQIKVYQFLINSNYASTISYKEIAEQIGSKAYRVIGNFMKNNPFLIVIPCHRVILSTKKIGEYVLGTNIKMKLIQLEKDFNRNLKE